MELLKTIATNGVSMLLALIVAFFLLQLFGKLKKKGGCGCGCGGGGSAAPAMVDGGEIITL